MAGYSTSVDGDFDRVYMSNSTLFDQFVGTQLWVWGNGGSGQVGDGTALGRSSPVTTAGRGTTWSQVSAAYENIAAIKTDGTLWTWGQGTSGALGDGTIVAKSSPVTTAGGGTNWRQTSAGYDYTIAIKTDGTLWTWGYNGFGQLGTGTTLDRSSPATTAGGGTTWSQIACGYYHCTSVKSDGTLWTWGYNQNGQLGDGTTLNRSSPITVAGGGTNWRQIAPGHYGSAGIKTDGTLWTWGTNTAGNAGDGTTLNRSSPVTTAGGGTNWKQVARGRSGGAAIKTDGTLWLWGDNSLGTVGDGTTINKSSPITVVSNITTWKSVACLSYTVTALAQN
jgi:YD repeat-containing protein